jgi:hypothetical protein
MYDATYEPLEAAARPHAVGYSGDPDASAPVPLAHPGFVALPTTGLYASAVDAGRLAEHLLRSERMLAPYVETQNPFYRSHGYGLMVWEDDGMRLAAASDRGGGWSSLILLAPDEGFAVAVLSSCDWYEPSFAAYRAFEIFLGKRLELFTGEQTEVGARVTFAGDYTDPLRLGRVTVTNGTEGMRVRFWNYDDYETDMPQLAKNVFWFQMNDVMQTALGGGRAIVTFFEDPADGRRYFVTNVGVAARAL